MTAARRRALLAGLGAVALFGAAFAAGTATGGGGEETSTRPGSKGIGVQVDPAERIELKSTGSLPKLRNRPRPEPDQPPATDPPASEPPASEPPATDPPATEPPATEPPPYTPPPSTPPPSNPPSGDGGDFF